MRNREYTDEQLIKILQDKCAEIGRTISMREFNEDPMLPSTLPYCTRFGSWNNALLAAGLPPVRHQKHSINRLSKDELIEIIQDTYKKLGRIPTVNEIREDPRSPGYGSFLSAFGSITNAYAEAGLPIRAEYSDEELLQLLVDKAKQIGGIPKTKDISSDPEMPSPYFYRIRFGSLENARVAAGIQKKPKRKYSRKHMINLLQDKYKSLGRTPSTIDVNLDAGMPDSRNYTREFGTWNQALAAAGIPLLKRK